MTTLCKALRLLPLALLFTAPHLSAQEAPLFALLWTEPDNVRFEHQTPMVQAGGGSWVREIMATPEGRRALRVTWPHNTIWRHPDDRCRDAQGSLAHLSAQPSGSTMYKGGAGGDGQPSGFSCPWLDNWIEETRQKTQADVDALVAAGGTMDYLVMDVESKMDWLKIKSSWEDAIMADPRWPATQHVLDSLKRIDTGDPSATFTFKGGDSETDGDAWNAYMWAQQARALTEGIFKVYQAAFPDIKASNYEHHGRRPEDTTLETYGWYSYQTAVTGTHASDYSYGWIIQAKDANLGVRRMGEDSDWLIFVFEQRKARASVRAGYPIQPWIAYSGNRNIDWRTSVQAPASHKPNPFWEENIRHLLLLEADPLLYWNSRSYSETDHSTDELDGFVESILEEVNSRIGTASPRYTVSPEQVNWFSGPTNDEGRVSRLPDASGVVATGLRHGEQVTYRVAVERITNDPHDWEEVRVRVLHDSVDTGERLTVPAGETGVYYTTSYREGISFDFEPSPVRNLLASTDLTSGAWLQSGTAEVPAATKSISCPVEGIPVAVHSRGGPVSIEGTPVALKRGEWYTFSVYVRGLPTDDSGSGGVRLNDVGGERIALQVGYNRNYAGWGRFTTTFQASTDQVVPVVWVYRQYACAPALHEGVLPGRITGETKPYDPVAEGMAAEQRIQLQPGWNMVAFNVDPGDVSPDSVLAGQQAVALVRDVQGATFSTRFDIREIEVWDARTAYRVLVDEPTEIVLTGRPLALPSVELVAGWNLVPYASDEPLALADVEAAFPGLIVRAEDDRGHVYEPGGENVTLTSFEPGRAYRIYAARAAVLSFSP